MLSLALAWLQHHSLALLLGALLAGVWLGTVRQWWGKPLAWWVWGGGVALGVVYALRGP